MLRDAKQDTPAKDVHFFNLDVLRFFAAAAVVIYHGYSASIGWFGRNNWMLEADGKTPNQTRSYLEHFISNLNTGVDFFFVISGFLITYLLLLEKEKSGRVNIGKFYMRRVLRIWPLYFLVVCAAPILVSWLNKAPPNYLYTVFFANNYYAIHHTDWAFPFAQLWSVCVEEHFYLVWPLLIAFLPIRRLPVLFGAIILLCMAFRVYAFNNFQDGYNHVFYNTLSRVDEMVIGAIIAFWHFKKPIRFSVGAPLQVLFYAGVIALLTFSSPHNIEGFLDLVVKKYVLTGAYALVLINYLFNAKAIGNFTKKNVLHFLGKISFGIYMFHNIVIGIVIEGLIIPHQWWARWQYMGLYIGLTLAISVLSYFCLEKPILRLKSKFAVIKT